MGGITDAFEERLRTAVRGQVHAGPKARALYATDASNHRHVPRAVVLPADADDVARTVAACRAEGVPVTLRGGGTSVAGNATGAGVVVDTSRSLTRLLAVDPRARTALVEPGLVLDDLDRALAPHGLVFAPDPSTRTRATIGGMIGNDACGAHSVAWGRTSHNVLALDVLLPDGTRTTVGPTPPARLTELCSRDDRVGDVHRRLRALVEDNLAVLRTAFPQFPRRVSGYALDALLPERGFDVARALVGSEGTCVAVLSATLRLVPLPGATALVAAGFVDDVAAADAVPALLPSRPAAVEGIDRELVETYAAGRPDGAQHVRRLPPGAGWLLVELTGDTPAEALDRAREVAAGLERAPGFGGAVVVGDPVGQRALWRIREQGAGLATRLPDGSEAVPGWEDAAVPPDRLGAYLRDFRALLARHGRRGVSYGHFGDGCVHTRIDHDLLTPQGVAAYRAFVTEAADLVVAHGGSLSGEHGDGQARSELLPRMYPREVLRLFEEFKAVWDPEGLMNPGVLVRPRPLDGDLRVGARAARPVRDVVLAYPRDDGDFARAVRRCVGVGACRSARGGAMCPSYRATGEEQHSTRGRAHLLLEMLEGEVIRDGWRSREVHEALDLCLSCKACASDCPVDVDMAAYKAEFLAHHYRRRLRPAAHYSMGWLPLWARLAARAPRAVNALTSGPAAPLLRRLAGIAPEREVPRFARRTFTATAKPSASTAGGPRVLLWPDTFTDHFSPEVAHAAVRVLDHAGVAVEVPRGRVCCGLTWLSTGQLGIARRVLRRTLRVLEPHVGTDVLVVSLEPSCTAALRKDLPELLPGDPAAAWLSSSVVTFAEALERLAPAEWAPRAAVRTLRQTHCHQYSVLGDDADRRLLARVGASDRPVPPSCCGLAGDFGFARGHYEVSVAVAELELLPALRAEDAATTVLADGFSCRVQIEQLAGRRALHLAQLVDAALPRGEAPEGR